MIDNDTVHGRIAGRQNLVFVRLRRHVFKLKVSLIIFQGLQRYNHVKGKVNSAINSYSSRSFEISVGKCGLSY